MDMNEILHFIKENADEDDFTGGIEEGRVNFIESELSIKLPDDYRWFLLNFGMGGIFGVDILGVGKNNLSSVIVQTKKYRKYGMPLDFIVIEDCDEYIYCLVTSKMNENKKCQVVSWDMVTKIIYKRAENFIEFFSDRLLQAKENWEEYE